MNKQDDKSKAASERLVHAYDRMLQRAEHTLATAAARSEAALNHALEAAKEKAVELGELTREEADEIYEFVARDLYAAGRHLATQEHDIGDWLRDADVTHISNEVPFAVNCPPPDPGQADLRFCSDPRYIALPEDIGTDIIELTGDHFGDWGTAAMEFTLEQYRQRDWPYYGGGENEAEGKQAVIIEHNGNRLAFIGCNGKGRPFAGATATLPGAVVCDVARPRALAN